MTFATVVVPDLPAEPADFETPYAPTVVLAVIGVVAMLVFVFLSLFRGWASKPGGVRSVGWIWGGSLVAMIVFIAAAAIVDTTAENRADARQDAWWDEQYTPASEEYAAAFETTYGATLAYLPAIDAEPPYTSTVTVEFPDGHREDCTVDRTDVDGQLIDTYACPTPLPLGETP